MEWVHDEHGSAPNLEVLAVVDGYLRAVVLGEAGGKPPAFSHRNTAKRTGYAMYQLQTPAGCPVYVHITAEPDATVFEWSVRPEDLDLRDIAAYRVREGQQVGHMTRPLLLLPYGGHLVMPRSDTARMRYMREGYDEVSGMPGWLWCSSLIDTTSALTVHQAEVMGDKLAMKAIQLGRLALERLEQLRALGSDSLLPLYYIRQAALQSCAETDARHADVYLLASLGWLADQAETTSLAIWARATAGIESSAP